MLINKSQLETIRNYLSVLSKFGIDYEDLDGYLDEEEYDEIPDEIEFNSICLLFPDDQERYEISLEDFLSYMAEIDSLVEVGQTGVRTAHYRQVLISLPSFIYVDYDDRLHSYCFKGEGYEVSIVDKPFLIGVDNAQKGRYDEDLGSGCTDYYTAIEIKYSDTPIEESQENELIERILYYLTIELKTAVSVLSFPEFYYSDNELDEDTTPETRSTDNTVNVSDIQAYSPLMTLYRQAKRVEDPEIQFLQYYKVIEQVSPVVARLVAYERLNKRLDLLSSMPRDFKFLDSIFAITRQYDYDQKDEALAFSVLQICVDLVPLYGMIPKKQRKHIKAELHLAKEEISDVDLSEEQLKSLQRQFAKMLYSTRNSIVHAKANYVPSGLEFYRDDLPQVNEIMDIIAVSIINWNARQPEGFKI